MVHRYAISLNHAALRAAEDIDLSRYVTEHFPEQCRVVERGFRGRSVTVEMTNRSAEIIREKMSAFAIVELDVELKLLGNTR